jgi:choline monooxygenase
MYPKHARMNQPKPRPDFINSADLSQQPIQRADTLPSSWYTEPGMLLVENAAVFGLEWQLAGHLSQLEAPGSSLCIEVAGEPVIVVRDIKANRTLSQDDIHQIGNIEPVNRPESDETAAHSAESPHPDNSTVQNPVDDHGVRAFFNVCRHRGGPLAVKTGSHTMLQCQYHGWTYRTDGSLRGVPHFRYAELFDKKDFGLTPVAVEVWEGLIFVSINPNPRNLMQALHGIPERIQPNRLQDFKYHTRTEDIINCNWKVYVDNYLEGYHIPIVHPELARLLDYNQYVTETAPFYSLQHSPFASTDGDNPYSISDGQAWYYFIYPNIMLNILPGRLQTNIVEPLGHDRCRVIFDFYYTDVQKAISDGSAASDMEYSALVQREDIEICEAVQKGLNSRAYDKGRFSVERELGVYHFQSLIKQSLSRYFAD